MTAAALAPSSRAERRTQTRAQILAAARELFAERGYLETTIRAIAHRVGVDPALVMQHFGTKSALFDVASDITLDLADALAGPQESLGERVLRHVLADVDGKSDASLPVLRSMLTHPEAAEAVRCAVAHPQGSPLMDVLSGPEADLRAGLISTVVLGLLVARYLLRIPEVAEADPDRIAQLLGPCLRPLVAGDAPVGGPRPLVATGEPSAGHGATVAGPRSVAAEPTGEVGLVGGQGLMTGDGPVVGEVSGRVAVGEVERVGGRGVVADRSGRGAVGVGSAVDVGSAVGVGLVAGQELVTGDGAGGGAVGEAGPAVEVVTGDGLVVAGDESVVGGLAGLAAAEVARREAEARTDEYARAALAAGASYADVGRVLGISRQAARKRWPEAHTPG